MSTSYGSGAKGKCTKLHAKLIRERGVCEYCGVTEKLQCAHIVSRTYSSTRTDLDNAFCLCASCHWKFGSWPVDFGLFVLDKITHKGYQNLAKKARAGIGKKFNWDEELERLKGIEDECKTKSKS